MKDTKEIVLFFDKNTSYDTLKVAKEIVDRYPELGNPIILPEVEKQKTPLMVFNTNPDFQLQGNYYSINFVVNHNYFDKLSSIIFDLVDTLAEFNCNFIRLGYISNMFLAPQYIEKVKNMFLKLDHLDGVQDFNLSWYKKLETKIGNINCWERFITDSLDFDDLLIQFDFNSPINVTVDFDIKYIKDFIKLSNDYIEDRTDI